MPQANSITSIPLATSPWHRERLFHALPRSSLQRAVLIRQRQDFAGHRACCSGGIVLVLDGTKRHFSRNHIVSRIDEPLEPAAPAVHCATPDDGSHVISVITKESLCPAASSLCLDCDRSSIRKAISKYWIHCSKYLTIEGCPIRKPKRFGHTFIGLESWAPWAAIRRPRSALA